MQGKVRLLMSLEDLRAHRGHVYAEYDTWCGYCWLESEATAGEPGGGGYDYYVPINELTQEQVYASHEAALGCAVPGCVTDHEGLHHTRRGSGGEYAPEPAYRNPFALVGSIGGFLDLEHQASASERFYNAYRYDVLIGMSVRRPIDMITITNIS
jgi:hypothetical protein